MPIHDLVCPNGHEQLDVMLRLNASKPACLECGEQTDTLWRGKSAGVIGDDIPGGVLIKHGICNEDGSPRRYYSKSEMARAAKAAGLANVVRHVPDPYSGGDKAKHTTRWI